MLGIANLSYNGHFLFAGTADSQTPYVLDPNSPGGVAYQGNDPTNQIEVEQGHTVAMNLPGSQLFSATGANVFEALSDLATALQSGTGIDTATESVRAAFDQLTSSRVFYGSTVSQLDSDQTFLQSEKLQLPADHQRQHRRGHERRRHQPGQRQKRPQRRSRRRGQTAT